MRGKQIQQTELFSYIGLEDRVPRNHPLRKIKALADKALLALDKEFDDAYEPTGRQSIPPEYLIRASLLQVIYGIRSEIQLIEQLQYNLLYRWFVGLDMDTTIWVPETFSVNRDRLYNQELVRRFFEEIVELARKENLLSDEHFSVDGTLLQAWASQKSFRPKDKEERDNDPSNGANFKGKKRCNDTHESTTDPDARLYKKALGDKSILSYMAHAMSDNRNGIAVDVEVTITSGKAEREATKKMMKRHNKKHGKKRRTLGADKGYDTKDMVLSAREEGYTPHIAIKKKNGSGLIDGRTTRHSGYQISIRKRKLIETLFGWHKGAARLRQVLFRGIDRVSGMTILAFSAQNLFRIANCIA
ncbi:MAG: IS5 family transposase [Candidatus Scalindua sp.]|nr:IS5 family transposase [Candidatus Scalindua sp.]